MREMSAGDDWAGWDGAGDKTWYQIALFYSLLKPSHQQVRKPGSHAPPLERLTRVRLDVQSMRCPWENDYGVVLIASLLQCLVDIRYALRHRRK